MSMERICKDPGHRQWLRKTGEECTCHKYVPASDYDSLAAHVEQLQATGDALYDAFGVILPGVKYIALQDYSVLNAGYDWQQVRSETPLTSLAKLKAQWQAEGARQIQYLTRYEDWEDDELQVVIDDYINRQAGGEE